MALTTLKDDLLQEFREERILIKEQIEILDPLAITLRKPAAQRLLSSGTLIITEMSCYIVCLGGIAGMILMHLIYPFNVLNQMLYSAQVRNGIGAENVLYLTIGVYALAALCVFFVFIIGRMAREMRLKNDILSQAGKDIKTIIGQHLERKAVMDTIEQRHMLGLSGISQPAEQMGQRVPVTEIANPGY